MMEFDIVRTTAELERLEPEWQALWQEDRRATPFQSPEWLLPWWSAFGQQGLRAVRILQQGRMTGLLPFYLYGEAGYGEPGSGQRRILLLGAGTSDYLDGVFSPECRPAMVGDAVGAVCAEGGWDSLDILQVRPGSLLAAALGDLGAARLEAEPCSRLRASRMEDLPKKMRRTLANLRNRAERLGAVEMRVADSSCWQERLESLHRLHTLRWESREEGGVVADARVRAWHGKMVPRLLEAGLARLTTLTIGGEAAAALWSICDPAIREGRTRYFYLTGFDPQFAACSPGTLLYALEMDGAAQDGFAWIDLLRGTEGYKQLWHAEPVATMGLRLLRRRMAAAA